MFHLETIAALVGIVTFVGGGIAWYRGAIQKEYASQRDWEHVKNNQKQLVENLNFIFKEIDQNFERVIDEQDSRFDKVDSQLIEIKSMFYASLGLKKKRNENGEDY